MIRAFLLAVSVLVSPLVQAQSSTPSSLDELLAQTRDARASEARDNAARVERFLADASRQEALRAEAEAALRQHQRLAAAPVLHQRYQVSEPVEPPPPTSPAGGLLDRIRGLRNRVWGRSA